MEAETPMPAATPGRRKGWPAAAAGLRSIVPKGLLRLACISTRLTAAPRSSAAFAEAATQQQCEICYSNHAQEDMVCAGSAAARSNSRSSSAACRAHGCGHPFCFECMRQYVCTCVDSGKHSVKCPSPGCKQTVAHQDIIRLLRHSPAHTERYTQLQVESAIPPSQRVYCPHKDCSAPLMKPAKKSAGRTTCPACERTLCSECLIPGWHEGYTCKSFQALPAHLRSAEDAALLRLSAVKLWKQCPKCRHMIERSAGCVHMVCPCGARFCYSCGRAYRSRPFIYICGHCDCSYD